VGTIDAKAEIPPRARGRGQLTLHTPTDTGNTPACAGKSEEAD